MRRYNYNEAITGFPVLLPATKDSGDGWVAAPEPVQLEGQRVPLFKRHPVRVVPAEALIQFANPETRATFEAAFGRVEADFRLQLLSMLGIVNAIEKDDTTMAAEMAARATASHGEVAASWARAEALFSPWDKAAATLNAGLFRIMPVLWRKGTQLAPALLCRTPAQALFAHALFRVTGKHGLGVCRRCGNPFFASRSRQSFCSYKCRTAEAMKRYRANLKLNETQRARQVKSRRRTRR